LLRDGIDKSFDREIVEALMSYYYNIKSDEKNEDAKGESIAPAKGDHAKARESERIKTDVECSLKLIYKATNSFESIKAIALNYSEGGMALSCEGEEIPRGANIEVDVKEMDITGKIAKAVWSSPLGNGRFRTGLQWV